MAITDIQRNIIRNKITSLIEDLQDEIEEMDEMTQPISPDRAIGRISRMDAIHNKSINESLLRSTQERLAKLEYTLTQIEKSDYGICQACGGEISPNRLLEVPEATRCANCPG